MKRSVEVLDPGFVILGGYAAAGKTELAREIARNVANAVYIHRDSLYKANLSVSKGGFPVFA